MSTKKQKKNQMIEEEHHVILKNELTKEQKEEIKDAFDSIDTDGSGQLEVNELKIALEALGFDSRRDETNRIIDDMDKNKDGQISYDEFLSLLTLQIVNLIFYFFNYLIFNHIFRLIKIMRVI